MCRLWDIQLLLLLSTSICRDIDLSQSEKHLSSGGKLSEHDGVFHLGSDGRITSGWEEQKAEVMMTSRDNERIKQRWLREIMKSLIRARSPAFVPNDGSAGLQRRSSRTMAAEEPFQPFPSLSSLNQPWRTIQKLVLTVPSPPPVCPGTSGANVSIPSTTAGGFLDESTFRSQKWSSSAPWAKERRGESVKQREASWQRGAPRWLLFLPARPREHSRGRKSAEQTPEMTRFFRVSHESDQN